MKATKVTLVADVAQKIATGGVDSNTLIQTALTDVYLGDSSVLTSDGAASFKFGSIATPVSVGPVDGELWAISHAGGSLYVLTQEAG